MQNKKFYILIILVLTFFFSTQVFASLTFTTDAITGTTDSSIDLGAGNNLFLQTSGGKIGIGTATPLTSFHVSGTPIQDSTSSLFLLGNNLLSGIGSNTSGTFLGINSLDSYTGDFLNFQNNGVNVFRISNEGGFLAGNGGSVSMLQDYFPLTIMNGVISSINNARINQAAVYNVLDFFDMVAHYSPSTNYTEMILNGPAVGSILTAESSGAIKQMNGFSSVAYNLGNTNLTEAKALVGSAHNGAYGGGGSGNVTSLKAGEFVYANLGSGSITNAYGIFIESPGNDGNGIGTNNITNAYGLYIENQDKGTNKWNIYSAGASSRNVFEGSIKVDSALNKGTVALTGGTATVTVNSGAVCVVSETTDETKTVKGVVSGTTLTITGTGTDTIAYVCL
ncbi:MAG: hypothetical protein UU10_C0018G0007 [Parcubacteria group bacterium GW2011_GWF1_40_6]|uniref:Uncharacterized protein n=2 Tax=Candidatus Nomuraibacteriota TaxID=1752729 RepID=A0A0G0T856_9BACT|nr:MAG: hypothetical protein UT78_C0006G0024 [Candidatus Nomurabacteria bacterium GW2011_GWF2_40_12]KKR68818.1 MAG: hypothetical protein UU10_C0018G0007 [Parcubacteria group bacterium GW2011_GWF1_40_6]OGJ08967.1 MAG: hypothetical protein A2356_02725 [Candidatus Nomurabacteria bacterium RIFOXYB1_FULL_39_16]OGJ14069.1 MAG: hypothetical protein A2585_03290 [Candidatus Nomurabacteria bacterium RIFOXYD1_FULL_39_12]